MQVRLWLGAVHCENPVNKDVSKMDMVALRFSFYVMIMLTQSQEYSSLLSLVACVHAMHCVTAILWTW